MIWFILGLIGFVVFFIWLYVEEWEWLDWGDRVIITVLSFLAALIASVLCYFISSLVVPSSSLKILQTVLVISAHASSDADPKS